MTTALLNPILRRFAEHFPIPTMARAVLERCLNPQQRPHVSVARVLAQRKTDKKTKAGTAT